MDMIDYRQLPIWAILVLVIAREVKPLVVTFVPESLRTWWVRRTDREEHVQEIEQAIVDSELQASAAAQLRESWKDENIFELLRQKDSFFYQFFGEQAQEYGQRLAAIEENGTRTNDLLTLMNANLTKLIDAVQVKSRW
jgi:hypothetical protein